MGEKVYYHVGIILREKTPEIIENKIFPVLLALIFLFYAGQAFSEEQAKNNNTVEKTPAFAGEFFGAPVPIDNYYFVKSVIRVFGNKWGPQPQTPEEEEGVIWEQLLFSYEAFRRGITASDEEFNNEIENLLKQDNVSFDWKTDKESYSEWVKKKTGEPVTLFENQMRHLYQIHKLREQVMNSSEPSVSNKEAFGEFQNENNNLGIEFSIFTDKKSADVFYRKALRNAKFWDEERERKPDDFKGPSSMSLEAWIDLWKIPKEDAYKMLRVKDGSIYPPTPIYNGYAVFRVTGKGLADNSRFLKYKKSYYEQIKTRKRYIALGEWIKELKKEANIKVYKENL